MFTRVKMSAEEEIKCIVVCMRVLYDRELRKATGERMFNNNNKNNNNNNNNNNI